MKTNSTRSPKSAIRAPKVIDTKPAKKVSKQSLKRKPVQRKPVDNRPGVGYALPVTKAQRTYLVGDRYTKLHIHANNRINAVRYYRERLKEMNLAIAPNGETVTLLR